MFYGGQVKGGGVCRSVLLPKELNKSRMEVNEDSSRKYIFEGDLIAITLGEHIKRHENRRGKGEKGYYCCVFVPWVWTYRGTDDGVVPGSFR